MITCMNFVSFNQQLSDLVMYMYVYSLQVLSAVETPSGLFPRLVEPWAPLFSIPDFAGSRRPTLDTASRRMWGSLEGGFGGSGDGGFVHDYPDGVFAENARQFRS